MCDDMKMENSDDSKGGNSYITMPDPEKVDQKELKEFYSQWGLYDQVESSVEDYYFNSYSHFGVHEDMLKDRVRTGTYKFAILENRHLFKNKVVLDVGSGTGILSMFAASAGAKHVYAIECSEIVELAKRIVAANLMSDRVTFIKGKAEEVELPVEKVDIILSEWMGYFLLYESMLDTVLYCRDKWLVEGGLIFPDQAFLYIAGIEDAQYKDEKFGFWDNVYGYNYRPVKGVLLEEPVIDSVDPNAVSTTHCCILRLNLNTCTKAALDFSAPYKLHMKRKDFVHAMVVWFDVSFSACHKPIGFSTGPYNPVTHWKQSVLYIEEVLIAEENEIVEGMIAVRKNKKNFRDIDIKMYYQFKGQICNCCATHYYRMR